MPYNSAIENSARTFISRLLQMHKTIIASNCHLVCTSGFLICATQQSNDNISPVVCVRDQRQRVVPVCGPVIEPVPLGCLEIQIWETRFFTNSNTHKITPPIFFFSSWDMVLLNFSWPTETSLCSLGRKLSNTLWVSNAHHSSDLLLFLAILFVMRRYGALSSTFDLMKHLNFWILAKRTRPPFFLFLLCGTSFFFCILLAKAFR